MSGSSATAVQSGADCVALFGRGGNTTEEHAVDYRPDWSVRFDDARRAPSVRGDFLAHLREWGAPDSNFEAALLGFDALVENVITHACGPLRIELDWSMCTPILHVFDRGPGFALEAARGFDEPGRGLFRVTTGVGPMSIQRITPSSTRVSVTLPVHRKECRLPCRG